MSKKEAPSTSKDKGKKKTRPLEIAPEPKPETVKWDDIKGLDYHLIGNGTFSEVFRFVRDNKTLAIKQYKQYNESLPQWKREIEILTEFLPHENFIDLLGHGSNFEAKKRFLIMEYVPMTLSEKLEDKGWVEVGWEPVLKILQGIASVLDCLHRYGLVYSDLKPDNMVISEDFRVKMIDFGGAVREGTTFTCTNKHYVSPNIGPEEVGRAGSSKGGRRRAEPKAGKDEAKKPAKKSRDVYSFGVLMLQLVMKLESTKMPVKEGSNKGSQHIVQGLDRPPENIVHKSLSNTGCDTGKVVDLVRRCTHSRPPTMDEVVRDLEQLKKKK
ncbi:hypothetical protein COLO4_18337 [Corchorus olitorius]|uniref:Protein kinase domain-containing protein n=1 Tax=Corchorus olitorius TaxID=93759 RepID=A0A1R3J9H5_9ROSI|nr:hypothetical protein COLO4_18337 [Corchorus olitorius]